MKESANQRQAPVESKKRLALACRRPDPEPDGVQRRQEHQGEDRSANRARQRSPEHGSRWPRRRRRIAPSIFLVAADLPIRRSRFRRTMPRYSRTGGHGRDHAASRAPEGEREGEERSLAGCRPPQCIKTARFPSETAFNQCGVKGKISRHMVLQEIPTRFTRFWADTRGSADAETGRNILSRRSG